jgi:lipid-A-disaccharide synthase-like uncharacterized protein
MTSIGHFLDSEHAWIVIGLAGQLLFSARFLIQWLASEKQKRSMIPIAFWHFSIGGGLLLLLYSVHRMDPVFILGQSMGLLIYARNLSLIRGSGRIAGDAKAAECSSA